MSFGVGYIDRRAAGKRQREVPRFGHERLSVFGIVDGEERR